MYFEARKPINDEISNQENTNKEKKLILIKKVSEISNDDNEVNIQEFKKLKDEWIKVGPVGRKSEKKMWDEFNKNADRFFIERNQKIQYDIDIVKNLNEKLNNDEISIREIKNSLNEIKNIKNTKEFKKINKDLKSKISELNKIKKEAKVNSYVSIYDALVKTTDIENVPLIFKDSIEKSFENNNSNDDELRYVCIKLEILSGNTSLKKDQELRNNIQLELLSNKFNKSSKSNLNDLDSLIDHFILNFSKDDTKTNHANYWKRIVKCINDLIS